MELVVLVVAVWLAVVVFVVVVVVVVVVVDCGGFGCVYHGEALTNTDES